MSRQVDFFFNFGSTNSHLSIMRLEDEAAKAGIDVLRWRPFNVRKLFVEQTNIPFPKEKAAKVAASLLVGLGLDAQALMARADSDEGRAAFDAETDVARSLGIFGVPTFVVGTEIFWGHDRMEDAFAWARETSHAA